MSPEISVIVPCFNEARHLDKCLKSLLRNDFKDFEIVCVNDCSTDDTINVLRQHENADQRVRVIDSHENLGSHGARLAALEAARAPYVTFCDADDFVSRHYLSNLCRGLSYDSDVDVVVGYEFYTEGIVRFRRNTLSPSLRPLAGSAVEVDDDILKGLFGYHRLKLSLCGNLYRSEQFRNIPDFKVFYQEDVLTNMHIFSAIKTIALAPGCDYHYRTGGYSSVRDCYINDFITVARLKKDFVDARYPDKRDFYAGISIELKNSIYEWLVRRYLSGFGLTEEDINIAMPHDAVEILSLAREYAPSSFDSADFRALLGRNLQLLVNQVRKRITWRRRISNAFRTLSSSLSR